MDNGGSTSSGANEGATSQSENAPQPNKEAVPAPHVEKHRSLLDLEAQRDPNALGVLMKDPSETFTPHQLFYLLVLDGVGAVIISGGINLAIAYGMYTSQKYDDSNTIRLFQLPNTLAGDAGVTIIIQCLITWMINLFLVNRDLKTGHVQAVGKFAPPQNRFMRWFMFLKPENDNPDNHAVVNVDRSSVLATLSFLAAQALRAMICAVPAFIICWPLSMAVLTKIGTKTGGDFTFASRWAPQIFKGLLGGGLAFLITPVFTLFWLVRCGWALKRNEEHYGERVSR